MSPEPKPVIEYEAVPHREVGLWRRDVLLVAVLGMVIGANALVAVSLWPDDHPFGWFAIIWVVVGTMSLAARAAGCRWISVLSSVLVSGLGFCVNVHYLAEITASV